jgi:hypothetical protein
MAVSLTDSHGHPEDGQSVPPRLKKAIALPDRTRDAILPWRSNKTS